MLPPEIVPVDAISEFIMALCFIEEYNPIWIPKPIANGTRKYHKLLKFAIAKLKLSDIILNKSLEQLNNEEITGFYLKIKKLKIR